MAPHGDQMKLNNYSHGFGQLTYHIVFVPKYRRPIFNEPFVKKACEMLFEQIASDHNFEIIELEVMPDHIHLFVAVNPSDSISRAVQLFKGISARRLFQRFPELAVKVSRKHIWSAGKFYRSVGNVTADTIKHYIACSQHEWNFEEPVMANACAAPGQYTMTDFMA
jgi:putative transposase